MKLTRVLMCCWLGGCGSSFTLEDSDALRPGDGDGDGVIAAEDCDDEDENVFPGAIEICNGIDDDCDERIDDADDDLDLSTGTVFYADVDDDGFGDADNTTTACEAPSGYGTDATDCDDDEAEVNPDATEICNGIDDDCDDAVDLDDDSLDTSTSTYWYADSDGDGYGDPTTATESCEPPGTDYVLDDTDCDDADEDISPAGTEVCDGVDDEDCDDTVDEDGAADASTFYADADGDGYGDAASTTAACELPSGYADNAEDCDDTRSEVSPAGTEVCDGVTDEDCDETVDESGAADASTFYADSDGDGYGDVDSTTTACEVPTGYVDDDDDCDDTDEDISPDATEICDGSDNDCDGDVDDDDDDVDTSSLGTYYADDDGDGYGDADEDIEACSVPSGYVTDDSDCDDADSSISPAGTEVCDDDDDEDCDGDVDEDGASDASTFYADADADGFGDADVSTAACEAPSGYVTDDSDCDDSASVVNPDADERCDGTDDEDCDGDVDEDGAIDASTWYADGDGDGYGDASDAQTACDAPTGYVSDDADCDDADTGISPAATEVCDGVDNDCDGDIDDEDDDVDTGSLGTYYADVDEDGFGDASSSTTSCSVPSGYVTDDSDCDDGEENINPDADELCDGSTDEDCDGSTDESTAVDATTWYLDNDGDGYGVNSSTSVSCTQPVGYEADGGDCDDSDTGISPGAQEQCDGSTDEDCDGSVDEAGASSGTTAWPDADGDGYGDESASSVELCTLDTGYATNDDDCDDTEPTVYLGATEVCDDLDNDCDGTTDEDMGDLDLDGDPDCIDSVLFTDDFSVSAGSSDYAQADFSGTGGWDYRPSTAAEVLREADDSAVTVYYVDGEVDESVTHYSLTVDIAWKATSGENNGGGILFGWDGSTSGDYWLVTWADPQGDKGTFSGNGRIRLLECTGTSCTELDGDDTTVTTTLEGTLSVEVDGADITVNYDYLTITNDVSFTYTASSAVAAGIVGLYSDDNNEIDFDDFTVTNEDPL